MWWTWGFAAALASVQETLSQNFVIRYDHHGCLRTSLTIPVTLKGDSLPNCGIFVIWESLESKVVVVVDVVLVLVGTQ